MKRILAAYRGNREEFWRIARYLITGGWNTFFGFGVYWALYAWLGGRVHYLLLMIPANVLAITNAYVCYKLFVFKTTGNILREYLRCYVVYGGSMLVGFAVMYALVDGVGLHPVVAQAVCIFLTTIGSYVAHRCFSFKPAA